MSQTTASTRRLLDVARQEADALAVILGIKPGLTAGDMARNEKLRDRMTMHKTQMSELQRSVIMTSFTASYLPQLVHLIMNPSPGTDCLYNSNLFMLRALGPNENRYLAKYLLSDSSLALNGKRLAGYYASDISERIDMADERLREVQASGSRRTEEEENRLVGTANNFNTLTTLIGFHDEGAGCVDENVKARLLPFLRKWGREWRNHKVGRWFDEAVKVLTGESMATARLQARSKNVEGLQSCGKVGCTARYDLLMCARCRTKLYCCLDHQKDDWQNPSGPHQAFCYATAW